jgi:type II secretory pathway pseudopilin PulG
MLVVIAIIGILSASVLVALGPSRDKAKDARIISGIKQAQAIIETLYNPTGGTPYTGIAITDSRLTAIVDDVKNQGGVLTLNNIGSRYNLYSALITKSATNQTQYYCVDSSGISKTTITPPASGGLCPTP